MKGDGFPLIDLFNRYGPLLMRAMGQTLLLALYGLFFACIIGLIVGIISIVLGYAFLYVFGSMHLL